MKSPVDIIILAFGIEIYLQIQLYHARACNYITVHCQDDSRIVVCGGLLAVKSPGLGNAEAHCSTSNES